VLEDTHVDDISDKAIHIAIKILSLAQDGPMCKAARAHVRHQVERQQATSLPASPTTSDDPLCGEGEGNPPEFG